MQLFKINCACGTSYITPVDIYHVARTGAPFNFHLAREVCTGCSAEYTHRQMLPEPEVRIVEFTPPAEEEATPPPNGN